MFELLETVIVFTGMAIIPIAIVGIIQRNKNKERERKHEIEMFKLQQHHLLEMTELERIKQENYLLENADMRKELEKIRKENESFNNEKQKDSRWLIEETNIEK